MLPAVNRNSTRCRHFITDLADYLTVLALFLFFIFYLRKYDSLFVFLQDVCPYDGITECTVTITISRHPGKVLVSEHKTGILYIIQVTCYFPQLYLTLLHFNCQQLIQENRNGLLY